MNDRDYIIDLIWPHPLLTPRASAVLAAVEEAMGECDDCRYRHCDCLVPPQDRCSLATIREAWKENA